jgi:hypothetical protein
VPMLPEPMMATGHLRCDGMVFFLGEIQRHSAQAADGGRSVIAGMDERSRGERPGHDELTGQDLGAEPG